MKHRRIISLLSAALLGFSAAAFPPDALKPVEIVAEAATTTKTEGDWSYSSSIRVARESWGLLSSPCRKKETSSRLVSRI